MIINKQVRDLKIRDKILIASGWNIEIRLLTAVEYLPESKQMRIEYLYGGEPAVFVLGLKMTVPVVVTEFQI